MNIFLSLALILISAKLLGKCAKKLQIPAVIGELCAGVIIGPSLFNWIRPTSILEILADIAVMLLLFEVGFETQFSQFKKVGGPALKVAIVGFILPFVFAYPLNHLVFHLTVAKSLFIAGALTATSIGITVRVLADLKKRHTHEAHIVIAAAVFDDILGVLLLVVLLNFAGAGTESFGSAFKTVAILAAFAIGLGFSHSQNFKQKMAERCQHWIAVVTPIFFVMVGLSINLHEIAWNSGLIWLFSGSLFILAFWGKFLAGFVVKEKRQIQAIIGISMMPRGEVGLIFAQLGLQSNILSLAEYTVLILVVVATTFLAPFLLRWRYARCQGYD